jgi:hypothetical protein
VKTKHVYRALNVAGQRVVGVRVFASKPNSRTPVNFGIYRHVPSFDCHYILLKSFPLKITAVETVFDVSNSVCITVMTCPVLPTAVNIV